MASAEDVSAVSEAEDSDSEDWDDVYKDHHFGLESDKAANAYTSRGRNDAVWKILEAYGFRRSTDSKKTKEQFEGPTPAPCFELVARTHCSKGEFISGNVLENGEMVDYRVAELANKIRSSHHIDYMDDDQKKKILQMDDATLVRDALSVGGLDNGSHYFSFCRDDLEQSDCTWHCRICKGCMDWRDWHCKGCNTCKYGVSIPCDKCTPGKYQHRMSYG